MTTLLTYDLVTTPDPLQVNYSNAKLTVIASFPGRGPALVTQIQINIPFGTNSASLCTSDSRIVAAVPEGWTMQQGGSSDGQYIFVPQGSGGVIGGLAFVFTGLEINSTVGTASIGIVEQSGGGRYNSVDLPISKFPAEFELGVLVASPAALAAGGTSILSWDGSPGYNYSLEPHDLLRDGQIATTDNNGSATTVALSQNTVFTLTVSNGGGSSPFVTTRSVGVTVSPPAVDSFTLNGGRSGVTCDMGTTLTFSWRVSNADNVLLMAGNTPIGMFSADQQEISVLADRTARYWIAAYYGPVQLGVHSPPSDMIAVTLNPPQILSFGATMPSVYADYDPSGMALTWSVKNATSLTLQLGAGQGAFAVDIATTRYVIQPQLATQYTLVATYDPDEVPTTPVATLVRTPDVILAAQATSAKTSVSGQCSVTFRPCPLDITRYTFNPGGSWTRTLPNPIASMAWGLAGFDYSFADGDKHNLNILKASASTTVQGQQFTMMPTLVLSNDSGKTISSSSSMQMMAFTVHQDTDGAGAGETGESWTNLSATLSGTNYADIKAALAGFSFSSQTGTDGQISSITARIVSMSSRQDPSAGQTTVSVTATSNDLQNGVVGEKSYYWGVQSGILGRRSPPQGSGFAMKIVDQNTTTVDFDHPVASAYTMLTEWYDLGTSNGDNHTIKRLRSDYVAPTCNNTTRVTLDWGQAYWDDGKHTPWNATRQVILIAAYGTSR